MTENNTLTFKVSSALKNIIGRDLIIDKYVAIFELVKNSYDAGATEVKITFENIKSNNSKIIISDNGCGMDYEDIKNKWLFVAYSEKKKQNRKEEDYRAKIKRKVVGAKGVGRFSCDRLGSQLELYSKTSKEENTNKIMVDWNKFENNDEQEFIEIPVTYSQIQKMPEKQNQGTVLAISDLREAWDRQSLLTLKRSLKKLISPDIESENPFDIYIEAKEELATDLGKENDNKKKKMDRDKVNGKVVNDIFEKLDIKTTNIEVKISSCGNQIQTILTDRGTYIFKIVERNIKYNLLKDIHVSIFYLNKTAKFNFSLLMGVNPLNYGSVFIYKNGFRIYPYGNEEDDFFGINRRKQQGHNRYLGTREIMGRISIGSENTEFIEKTSRDSGFIKNSTVEMLEDFFMTKVLRVLENYVVNIIRWGQPIKDNGNREIEPNEIGNKIISEFTNIRKNSDIIKIDVNPELFTNLNQIKKDSIKGSINDLKTVAEKTNNPEIIKLANNLKKETEKVLKENLAFDKDIRKKEAELEKIEEEKIIREQQVFFLKGITDKNVTNVIDGMHSVFTWTETIRGNIDYLNEILEDNSQKSIKEKHKALAVIYRSNQKINKLAELAIKGNQTLKQIDSNSIIDFINQYINTGLATKNLKYEINAEDRSYNCKFDAVSMSIIFDNIASNSVKANASKLVISLTETDNYIEISFQDNGIGITPNVDPEVLFELGVTTTTAKKGLGIGLHHIRVLLQEMKGTVLINKEYENGFELVVRLKK